MAALPGLPASEHYWRWYHWVARCRLSVQQRLYAGQLGPGSVGSLTALTQESTLRLRSFFLKKKKYNFITLHHKLFREEDQTAGWYR